MTDLNTSWLKQIALWKWIGRAALIILLAVVLVWCGQWLYWRVNHVTTDAAYVKADMANVAAEVPGKITEVCIKEGQTVVSGQALFRIDPEQFDRQVNLARADLQGLLSTKDRSQAEVHQAVQTVPATVDVARAAIDTALGQKA